MSDPLSTIVFMYESPRVSESDGDAAALAEIAAGVESVDAVLRVAEIAQVRLLARAGQLARKQASGSPASVRLHDMALRSIAAELGGILRVADRTVQRRIDDARTLVENYPVALAAWEDGRITRGHVRVIVDAGGIVPPGTRERFEAEAVSRCERDTPNRVKAAIEMLAERLAERSFTDRHRDAADERCVRMVCGRDGMSDVVATVPTVIADGILDRLTQQAQVIIDARQKGEDDTRRIDQVRTDVFSDLLLAGTPALDAPGDVAGALGAIRAQVQVIVPALTLLGVDDGPADLVGRSPIDADTARCLARNATSWTRVLTDPIDGTVVAVDRYRVPWPQRRFLRARDQHCRFPGCRRPAIRSEIDHTVDAALGGPTALSNLAHLCQRHHSMKQFTRWSVVQLSRGVLVWTSPTGRVYREDAPAPPVSFMVAAPDRSPTEPPPF